MNNNNDQLYYSKIEKIVKYKSLGEIQDTVDVSTKIYEYNNTLSLDQRREALGNDLATRFFDLFAKEDSAWNTSFVSEFYAGYAEMLYLAAKPAKTLMTNPAFNYEISKLMNSSTDLTLVNNYQLDYLENLLQDNAVNWSYNTVTMQDIENETAGTYDFIFLTMFEIYHDVSMVKNFCNALNSKGTMLISYTNDDARLYSAENEYSQAYEMHQELKSISGVNVYHSPAITGHTVVIKD